MVVGVEVGCWSEEDACVLLHCFAHDQRSTSGQGLTHICERCRHMLNLTAFRRRRYKFLLQSVHFQLLFYLLRNGCGLTAGQNIKPLFCSVLRSFEQSCIVWLLCNVASLAVTTRPSRLLRGSSPLYTSIDESPFHFSSESWNKRAVLFLLKKNIALLMHKFRVSFFQWKNLI